MALKKVKGNFERIFDKNLTDLVRGIRNNKDNEGKYIAQCMEEIKVELRQDNIAVKANAVAKLTYLQMLGYDISWAVFNIIEVMSSTKFTYKRIGYLAAGQSFHPDIDLLMLTTNMIRKDLNSQNQYEAGLALSGLSCFISYDLARDLANDIITLMSSTKPYLRMKAVLMMYKVFLRYPEALRPAFPKLKEKLEDPDPGVQSAAVNVICELARKNPKNYLSLAPIFFKLMTTSTNNWMLIKIIKLFGALTPLEPRLGKKLIEPLTSLIDSTTAMSLLYECVNTVIAVLISISNGNPNMNNSVQLCVQKLRILIVDTDHNLKYLGLLAMGKILRTHPKSVQAHKDMVLQCLDDKDESIRLRALDLLYGMVSKKNLMEIVKKLTVHMEKAEGTLYRDELLTKIIEICSQNNYQHVVDFEWYVTVLIELIEMETCAKHGNQLGGQLLEVGGRVASVRAFLVKEVGTLIESSHTAPAAAAALYHAAYLLAEYADDVTMMERYVSSLCVCAKTSRGRAAAVCAHNAFKLTTKLLVHYEANRDWESAVKLCKSVIESLSPLQTSADAELQQRAHETTLLLTKLLAIIDKCGDKDGLFSEGFIDDLSDLFEGELKPVAPKAQKKVPVPQDLNLDAWLEYQADSSSSSSDDDNNVDDNNCLNFLQQNDYESSPKHQQPTEDEIQMMREARKFEQEHNPHYLKDESSHRVTTTSYQDQDLNDIPIAEIALEVPLQVNMKRSDKYMLAHSELNKSKKSKEKKKKRKSKKKKKDEQHSDSTQSENDEEQQWPARVVVLENEMPEGASLSDDNDRGDNDIHAALDQDLDMPLENHEILTTRRYDAPGLKSDLKQKLLVKDEKKEADKKSKKKKKHKEDKVDMMLDLGESNEKTVKHKKAKKDKKKKSSKEGSSKKATQHDYEEAAGISTPSKQQLLI